MSTASSVPSWLTAAKAAPGSLPKNSPDTIRRCPDEEIGRNSVRPWTRPSTTTSSQLIGCRPGWRSRGVTVARAGSAAADPPPDGRLVEVLRRRVGGSGLQVSRIGLGTMTWGEATDAEGAGEQLLAFVEGGGTLVETADVYGDGTAQEVLGAHLEAGLVDRDDLVITARGGPPDSALGRQAARGALLHGLDATLRRLCTDRLDLWQLPGWDPQVPLEETL